MICLVNHWTVRLAGPKREPSDIRKGIIMPSEVSLEQFADRFALRDLVDAYAHRADVRDFKGQAALYAENGRVAVYTADPSTNEPAQVLTGRDEIESGITATLQDFEQTFHFNGQSTVLTLSGDQATGESYCIAHMVTNAAGERTLTAMTIRYRDTFTRVDGRWLFAERLLLIGVTEQRPLAA
ncbi:nuclear transport factor 2 family protein [Micromonospora arborensis]|uniref:Nuclear transport factor 2 family protein n=2 Tax=Micromonospora arborensis TaxID=2116518 RepID=A0A318NDW1_9ACTN|nr:nuclear transport factor 2 family protein [Micromonospora arborensis]